MRDGRQTPALPSTAASKTSLNIFPTGDRVRPRAAREVHHGLR